MAKQKRISADRITERHSGRSTSKPIAKGRGRGRHYEYCDACEFLRQNSGELSSNRARVVEVFRKHHDELMSHPDVTGAHVGLKRINGKIAFPLRYCVRLHVWRKLPIGHPMLENPIDLARFKVAGIDIDITEQSYQQCANLTPPFPGNMIGGRPIHKDGFPDNWGTMGIIVFTLDGKPKLLTNRHVVGGPPVLSPADRKDDAKVREGDRGRTWSGKTEIVGVVEASVRDSKVDCAIIDPVQGLPKSSGIMKPDEQNMVLPGSYAVRRLTDNDAHNGTKVFKIGAATGFQPVLIGEVNNVETTVEFPGGHRMTGQIRISSTTQDIINAGDSGSIAIVKGQDRSGPINWVVGLIHSMGQTPGGSPDPRTIIASHFDDVQSTLRVSLFR